MQSLKILSRLMLATVVTCAAAQAAFAAPSADDILQRTRGMYTALKSYSDTGTVLFEAPNISERHSFASRYQAPRSFYFDFKKAGNVDRYVIWSDAEAFHTWWMTTGVEDEYPKGSGTGAFSQADYLTAGSALLIPTLLFSQSGLAGPLTNLKDGVLDGTEKVASHPCYKIIGTTRDVYTATGREVNIRKLTLWIDTESLLIRKIFEDTPKGSPVREFKHTTTAFEPQANPRVTAESFKFVAPAP
jgi:outer membrane lipoprotein-sorting protein